MSANGESETSAATIATFCVRHGISRTQYYVLRKAGLGPREMLVGARRFVSDEAAAEWRRQAEQRAAQRQASAIAQAPDFVSSTGRQARQHDSAA